MSPLTRYSAVTPKSAGRHLFDGGASRIAIGQRHEPVRFLAAFAGIRFAADAVHRDGQRGVRLAGDRAERHGAGREALDDFGGGLDLFDWDRVAVSSAGMNSNRPRIVMACLL